LSPSEEKIFIPLFVKKYGEQGHAEKTPGGSWDDKVLGEHGIEALLNCLDKLYPAPFAVPVALHAMPTPPQSTTFVFTPCLQRLNLICLRHIERHTEYGRNAQERTQAPPLHFQISIDQPPSRLTLPFSVSAFAPSLPASQFWLRRAHIGDVAACRGLRVAVEGVGGFRQRNEILRCPHNAHVIP
jgi:hypothetical protein